MIVSQGLTKKFDGFVALDNVSCRIPDGCIYGFVGSNGSGKSTFIRLATGVYKPESGNVYIDDMPVFENPEAKRRVAYVSDELHFFGGASMIRMAEFYRHAYSSFDNEKFYRLIRLFGLDPKKSISTFSKGMKRQAATITALCCGAKYMFFDETFDGLDAIVRKLIRSLLYDEVAQYGATVVIASHSLRELEGTCDQLALLHRGGLVLESEIHDLQTMQFKVQVAFGYDYDRTLFDGLDVVQFSKLGSVSNLIVRGDRDEVKRFLSAKSPVLIEVLPLSLEELFVYEMTALGYTFDMESYEHNRYGGAAL